MIKTDGLTPQTMALYPALCPYTCIREDLCNAADNDSSVACVLKKNCVRVDRLIRRMTKLKYL